MSDLTNLNNSALAADGFDGIEFLPQTDARVQASQALESQLTRKADADDKAFRGVKASKNATLQWFTRDANGNDTNIPELFTPVYAVRGVIIKAKFGMGLFDSVAKQGVCSTISAQIEGLPKVESYHPMHLPIYGPAQYNAKNTPHPQIIHFNTVGSRGQTCEDCVRSGNHVKVHDPIQTKGGKMETPKPDECGGNCSLLFCVMSIGFGVPNNLLQKMEVEWVDVVDYKDPRGNQIYNSPFMLNLSIPKSVATVQLGKKLQVQTEPASYVPNNSVTLKTYLDQLISDRLVSLAKADKDKHGVELRYIYQAVTEMHLAQPAQGFENQMITGYPVFRSVKDKDVVQNLPVWINTGWKVYENERMAFKTGDQSLLTAAPTPQSIAANTQQAASAPQVAVAAPAATTAPVTQYQAVETQAQAVEVEAEPAESTLPAISLGDVFGRKK